MKKVYLNPTIKVIILQTKSILQTSPIPDRFSLTPSQEIEYEGVAE